MICHWFFAFRCNNLNAYKYMYVHVTVLIACLHSTGMSCGIFQDRFCHKILSPYVRTLTKSQIRWMPYVISNPAFISDAALPLKTYSNIPCLESLDISYNLAADEGFIAIYVRLHSSICFHGTSLTMRCL